MPKKNQKNEQKFSIFGQSDVGMRCMINSDCIEFDQTKGIAILTDGLEKSLQNLPPDQFLKVYEVIRLLTIYQAQTKSKFWM